MPIFPRNSNLVIFSADAWNPIRDNLVWIEHELQAIRSDGRATRADVNAIKSVAAATQLQVDAIKTVADQTLVAVNANYANVAQLIQSILTPFVTTMEGVEQRLSALEDTVNSTLGSGLQSLRDDVHTLNQDVAAEREDLDKILFQFTPISGHITVTKES